MKYLKTYEKNRDLVRVKDDILTSAAYHFEDDQPITKEEGFIKCEYGPENFDGTVEFSFYFNDYIEEDNLEKFYKYLEDKNLELKMYPNQNILGPKTNHIEIYVYVPKKLYKKYAKLHDDINKFNL